MFAMKNQKIIKPFQIINPYGQSRIVLICEHASPYIPPEYSGLGLSQDAQISHIAWDPGAMIVAQGLSVLLNAPLVAGTISRLIYDCNRPPSAFNAIPSKSEIYDVPGNINLSDKEFLRRVAEVYEPFHEAVAKQLMSVTDPIIVTIHSFSPVYHGMKREVQIGILHEDLDSRLADSMMMSPMKPKDFLVMRNEPYGSQDGVMHTLREHALSQGRLNVMIEICNDLLETNTEQIKVTTMMADWITDAVNQFSSM